MLKNVKRRKTLKREYAGNRNLPNSWKTTP